MVIGIQVGKCLQKTLLNVIYSLFNLPVFCVTLRYIRKILAHSTQTLLKERKEIESQDFFNKSKLSLCSSKNLVPI